MSLFGTMRSASAKLTRNILILNQTKYCLQNLKMQSNCPRLVGHIISWMQVSFLFHLIFLNMSGKR